MRSGLGLVVMVWLGITVIVLAVTLITGGEVWTVLLWLLGLAFAMVLAWLLWTWMRTRRAD